MARAATRPRGKGPQPEYATEGPPSRAENAGYARAARTADRQRQGAYTGGQAAAKASMRERHPLRRHTAAQAHEDPELQDLYEQGFSAARRSERGDYLASSRAGRAGVSAGQEGAGFLLGLLVFALFAAYLRGGPAGVKGWLAAKFLNKPMSGAGVPAPASPAPPSGGPVGPNAPTPGLVWASFHLPPVPAPVATTTGYLGR